MSSKSKILVAMAFVFTLIFSTATTDAHYQISNEIHKFSINEELDSYNQKKLNWQSKNSVANSAERRLTRVLFAQDTSEAITENGSFINTMKKFSRDIKFQSKWYSCS